MGQGAGEYEHAQRPRPPGAAEGDMTVETRRWVTGRSDHVAEERGGRALGGEIAGPHG